MSFRIPKKPRTDASTSGSGPGGSGAPSSSGGGGGGGPPVRVSLPTSSGTSNQKTFQPMGSCQVQTNIFKVDIKRMPNSFTRLSMETHLCGGKIDIKLSEGHVAVSGGVNNTERRLALRTIFHKLVEKHPEIFGTNLLRYCYDCATTIYAIEGTYKGVDRKIEEQFEEKDFTEEQWATISKIIRRQNTHFKIILSANGVVYSQGPKSMTEKNRQELTRIIEICSSEVLNTPEFLQYGSQTFGLNEPPVFTPDATSEIRSGFDKGVRLLEGAGPTGTEIGMSIDTKLSPFYAASSVLKFVAAKFAEIRSGGAVTGAPRQPRRDPQHGRQRSRSRSPGGRTDYGGFGASDYDSAEINEIQNAFRRNESRHIFARIEDAMKGLAAVPLHLKKGVNRNILIHKFSESNAENTFFKLNQGKDDEKEVSVAEYFYEAHNIRLKFPYLPLIVTGRLRNQNFTPMEVLDIVPGQRIKIQKMTANVQASMTGQNATLPQKHVARIQEILKGALKMERNPNLQSFGIQVSLTPIIMPAQIISPAQIVFGNRAVCQLNPGSVQFRQTQGSKFARPAQIQNVAVIGFDGVNTNLDQFCIRLHTTCARNGLLLKSTPDKWLRLQMASNDTSRLKTEMKAFLDSNVSLLIGITPEKKPDVHDTMKYFEAGVGLQTLQIHAKTADCFCRESGGAQTIDNVMRKLNLKCGGINFNVEVPQMSPDKKVVCSNATFVQQKLFGKTQFVGFEMTHGSARTLYDKSQGTFDGEPTIVGCSYSLKLATELGGFNFVQEMNEHKLKSLDTKLTTCLEMYKKSAGSLPETLVVYRTGAGEGDYSRVQEEIQDMRAAIETLQGPKPKLIVLVVQKTSHVRIFPKEIKGTKAIEQNVKSGTVIEGQITSAGRQEFILVSQSALIGTVRPIKYTIMANDPGWSKNELVHTTYFLAFAHQVSYQPPAIPHVLYGAENLAKRGRNNFLMHKRLGELGKSIRNVLDKHNDLDDGTHEKELDSIMVDNVTEAMNSMAVKNKNFWA